MRYALCPLLALAALGMSFGSAPAHYSMFLPERHSVQRGEAVTILYQWGHPFEHQLFDALAPEKVFVLSPDGTITELTKKLEKVIAVAADAKQVTAYRLRFTPEQRGDYVFVLQGAPIWMPEDQVFFQDNVKVVLHVQAQKGWDTAAEVSFQLTPLTRPYGLLPDMAFQAEVQPRPSSGRKGDSPPLLKGTVPFSAAEPARFLVEVEHYNPLPPPVLPPDEQITRTVKTDPNNVLTCTLTAAGWWCITAQRDGGKRQHEGTTYPVRERATFWVYVDERVIPNPGK
jgi:uncharacterized GH25 family protein